MVIPKIVVNLFSVQIV